MHVLKYLKYLYCGNVINFNYIINYIIYILFIYKLKLITKLSKFIMTNINCLLNTQVKL